jgi:hypothetical protein
MAILYASAYDGRIIGPTASTWAAARDADGTYDASYAVQASVETSESSNLYFAAVARFGGRGGTTYRVYRSFLRFDTSSITGTVSGLKVMVHGKTKEDGGVRAVKASGAFTGTSPLGSLVVTDFDAINGYSAGSSMSGTTAYATGLETQGHWDKDDWNELTGTTALEDDMRDDNYVVLCFVNYGYDWRNIAPSANGDISSGAYYTDNTGTTFDPYIEYTVASAGYGHEVNTVAASSIGKVNTVTTANIGKINTVD